jgi:hypothetical protein
VAVDEMVAFIVARLDEQEERARRCTPGVWKVWGMSVMADQDGTSLAENATDVAHTVMVDDAGKPRTFDAQHIARHDPVWVLAEISARREMVTGLHAALTRAWQFGEEARELVAQLAVLMLQRFAALDRDHRDYDPGWEV